MSRRRFDALELALLDGERVLVQGRAELYEAKGELSFRASDDRANRVGRPSRSDRAPQARAGRRRAVRLGAQAPAPALSARDRHRHGCRCGGTRRHRHRHPLSPPGRPCRRRRDACPGRDRRPAHRVGDRTGRRAPRCRRDRRGARWGQLRRPVAVQRRGRRAGVCDLSRPVVSAVGHEQDTPLCDLAADVRASTPTAAARLVVPDLAELKTELGRLRERLDAGVRLALVRDRDRLARTRDRLRAAPVVILERRRVALDHAAARLQALSPRATLARGYAVVRTGGVALLRCGQGPVRHPLSKIELAIGNM